MLLKFGMLYVGGAVLGIGLAFALTGNPDFLVCVLAGVVTLHHGRETL